MPFSSTAPPFTTITNGRVQTQIRSNQLTAESYKSVQHIVWLFRQSNAADNIWSPCPLMFLCNLMIFCFFLGAGARYCNTPDSSPIGREKRRISEELRRGYSLSEMMIDDHLSWWLPAHEQMTGKQRGEGEGEAATPPPPSHDSASFSDSILLKLFVLCGKVSVCSDTHTHTHTQRKQGNLSGGRFEAGSVAYTYVYL